MLQQCKYQNNNSLVCCSILSHVRHAVIESEFSTQKRPDDIVITLAIRTALTKGKKGGFKDTDLDHILYSLLTQVLEKSKIDPSLVEDICLGNVKAPAIRLIFNAFELTSAALDWRCNGIIQSSGCLPCGRISSYDWC